MAVLARIQYFVQGIEGQNLILNEVYELHLCFQGELPDYLQDAIEFRLLLYTARELNFYNAEVAVSI